MLANSGWRIQGFANSCWQIHIGELMLANAGVGSRVLAAVYPFLWKEIKIYWIYQPRIKVFTPFVPDNSEEGRDHPLELRMEKAIRSCLPTSRDVKQWFPVWGLPL